MRTTVPLVITFLMGTLFVLEFFVPYAAVKDWTAMLQEWVTVVAASAFVLGGVNVLQVNIPKIRRREPDWGYKVVLVGSAAAMMVAGFWAGGEQTGAYKWLFDNFYAPSNATMFALLSFFIASAAFRAFRARNLEASLMLAAAIVVMLGVIPLGEKIPLVDFTTIKDWMLDYGNNAGRRAILIGAALGAIATGLRVILGLERSHLGSD